MKKMFLGLGLIATLLMMGNAWAETITFVSWGGTYNEGLQKTIVTPFTEATGIKVILTSVPSYAKLEAQVKTGNIEWDVVEAESKQYARAVRAGLFEPLDLSQIPVEDFVEGSATQYGVGIVFYSYTIAYRTDKWPAGTGPSSMKDFWDVKKFPGPRGVKYYFDGVLEAALMADGVPKSKMYPLDVDRALKKLDELKPHIRVFWKTGGQSQQIMRENEIDVGFVPGGRMIQLADQGVPVTWTFNDQVIVLDFLTIPKGSKKKEAAMKFIAFAAQPKQQAAFAEWTNYGPANKKAYNYISKEKAVLQPTYPENYAKGLLQNYDWYAENESKIEPLWERWKMKK